MVTLLLYLLCIPLNGGSRPLLHISCSTDLIKVVIILRNISPSLYVNATLIVGERNGKLCAFFIMNITF